MQKHGVAPTVLATLCHAGTCCYNCGEGPTVSKPAINQRRTNGTPRRATCSRADSTVGTNDVSRADPTFTQHPVVVELSRNRNAPSRRASKKPPEQRTITRLKTSKLAAQALGVATSADVTNPQGLGAT
uniref:Putative secreted protein n=1 Tax=Ixodes ricinus TaxID=34613 RepID=A0A6B0UQQ0_IXORI